MPLLRYTLLRLALLAGVGVLLWLLGLRGLLLALVAVVVAALLSFLLLPKHADEAAGVLARRHQRARKEVDEAIARDEAEEDALLDDDPPSPGDR